MKKSGGGIPMKTLTNYVAATAVLGMLAVPAVARAQERAPEPADKKPRAEEPADKTRLNMGQMLEEMAKVERDLTHQNYWVRRDREGKDVCYKGRDVNVEFTSPLFGFHTEQHNLIRAVFDVLKEHGYNPVDTRSYTHPLAGRIRVEYHGRKEGITEEKGGGLPTVVITLHYDANFSRVHIRDDSLAGRYAHTFSGVRGVDRNELHDFVKNVVPPVCALEKKNEQGQTGATGTERGQK